MNNDHHGAEGEPERRIEYDGECGLCAAAVGACQRNKIRATYVPVDGKGMVGVVYREQGRTYTGYQAVLRILHNSPSRLIRCCGVVGGWVGVRWVGSVAYRFVARHRGSISRIMSGRKRGQGRP
jgi:predicted DCC family thiol-disulfide oxidoreductase YuxK